VTSCPTGFVIERERGACCDTCHPNANAQYPNCEVVDCAPPRNCPIGYHHVLPSYRCCNECEPDPNYCQNDADCIIAELPYACCGCPVAIGTRLYVTDACYSALALPRSVPMSCQSQAVCSVACGVCPVPGIAACVDHSCTQVYPL
jgi:hypothetical protein